MAADDQIYQGDHLVHYGQVGLWDCEDPEAYPHYPSALPWWGPKGVVVPAMNDAHVAVAVHLGQPSGGGNGMTRLTSGRIRIGAKGVVVGNITTASTSTIDLAAGDYDVSCHYAGKQPELAEKVAFFLVKDG